MGRCKHHVPRTHPPKRHDDACRIWYSRRYIRRGQNQRTCSRQDQHVHKGHCREEQGNRGGELPLPQRRPVEHAQSQALNHISYTNTLIRNESCDQRVCIIKKCTCFAYEMNPIVEPPCPPTHISYLQFPSCF